MRCSFLLSIAALVLAPAACSEEVGNKNQATPGGDGGVPEDGGGVEFSTGEELRVPVPEGGRVHVSLASPASIQTPAAPATDKTWDLAFEGTDVFTNSGPSGGGAGSAFGPLEPIVFLEDVAPTGVPLFSDKTGGAFIRWWLYSGAPEHVLYSRFHVFGVKDGDKLYRVQVLGYYGERDGTSVGALYKIRYGLVGQPAKVLDKLDGTAGGANGAPDAKSECLDLGTDARTMLSPAEQRASSAWHLCFRREAISVNGEEGGPRGVTAVDFEAEKVASETPDEVGARTEEGELARFDAVTAASFEGAALRGDRVVSAFSLLWLERGASPVAPAKNAWLVVGADGKKRYLVGFSRFEGATATSVGTVVMRVKAVQ
ncbi:MAG: HmuY family protein [Labilithrix sp.]|nr:HmuY family protein [Labilithrix sp.]MCW5812186.1 HmuY family protein [Labilithrix sp.]